MKLLLDTSSFLWYILGSSRLTPAGRKAIMDPGNEVYLSSVSTWEIALKHAQGKLDLPVSPDPFITEQRKRHFIESLSLAEEAALHLARLPRLHNDPFDRMLICQSLVHGMTLVTGDPLISQYPAHTLW